MLAEKVDYVIGVDTHRDQHTLAVVVAPTGAVVAQHAVHTTIRGYAAAVAFAERFAAGVRVWAIEGAGHYGAGFTRYLNSRGQVVIEVARTARAERRLHGKDDPLDAIRAARSALASETLTLPRAGQEALRVLLLARRSAVDVRRLALVQLRSVIVTAPESLREELRRLPVGQLIRRCSRFRRSDSRTPNELAVVLVLRSLARRIEAATEEANNLEHEIRGHIRAIAPELLNEPGVGPIVAAQLIVTWSHRGRLPTVDEDPEGATVGHHRVSDDQALRTAERSRGNDRRIDRGCDDVSRRCQRRSDRARPGCDRHTPGDGPRVNERFGVADGGRGT